MVDKCSRFPFMGDILGTGRSLASSSDGMEIRYTRSHKGDFSRIVS